jgi:uncharacterized protein YqeY
MSLDEKLSEDLKASMKAGDTAKMGVLRLLKTRVKEASVEKRAALSDDEILNAPGGDRALREGWKG